MWKYRGGFNCVDIMFFWFLKIRELLLNWYDCVYNFKRLYDMSLVMKLVRKLINVIVYYYMYVLFLF